MANGAPVDPTAAGPFSVDVPFLVPGKPYTCVALTSTATGWSAASVIATGTPLPPAPKTIAVSGVAAPAGALSFTVTHDEDVPGVTAVKVTCTESSTTFTGEPAQAWVGRGRVSAQARFALCQRPAAAAAGLGQPVCVLHRLQGMLPTLLKATPPPSPWGPSQLPLPTPALPSWWLAAASRWRLPLLVPPLRPPPPSPPPASLRWQRAWSS